MPDVLMPRLSDSMEEGTILRWLKRDGADVARGDELAEIETDKATMTYEADDAGVLRILAAEGETVAVGTPIASLGEGTADLAEPAVGNGAVAASAVVAAPVARPVAARGVRATPLARRIAAGAGVDLAAVAGTGPGGRVTRADVAAAAGIEHEPAAPAVGAAAPAPAPAAAPGPDGARGAVTVVEPSRLQATIARRMAEASATVPDFSVQTEVDMTEAVRHRARLKELVERAPSLNDLIVQACARALRAHPRVNASYRDGRFELHERVNVGIAVAAADALVVPVVHDADRRTLGEIAATARRLAERVRDGAITPPELAGATFTVSNLGMFGMTAIAPVINLPNAAILGVGAVVERPVVRAGQIEARPMLTLTLTCDHRILYGADAAAFLATLRDLLEQPERIALSVAP